MGRVFGRCIVVVSVLVLSALQGCATKGFVAREWAENMRQLQIYPLFPPREDVYVGDVYLSPDTEGSQDVAISIPGYSPIGTLLAAVDLSKQVEEFYKKRADFPATSGAIATAISGIATNPGAIVAQPVTSGTDKVFTKEAVPNRLRQVAFPSFLSATVSGADVGALIPLESLCLPLGLSVESAKSASVSVPVAESYGVPVLAVSKNFLELNANPPKITIKQAGGETVLNQDGIKNLRYLTPAVGTGKSELPKTGVITVITEVFYARAIDVRLQFANSGGLRANAKPGPCLSSGSAGTGSAAAGPSPAEPATATAANQATSTPLQAARDAAAGARARAGEALSNQSTPGVSAELYAAENGEVGLRRTYERPIAIGYRGIRLAVNFSTGAVADFSLGSTPISLGGTVKVAD